MGLERFLFRLGAIVVSCGLLLLGGRARAEPAAAPGPDALPELGTGPSLAGLIGLPVQRIDVVLLGGRWLRPVTLRRVRVGVAFSSDVSRLALTELLDSGRYAGGRAEVTREGSG